MTVAAATELWRMSATELAQAIRTRQASSPTRRWFNGQIAPWEFYPTLMRLGTAYDPHTSFFSALLTTFAERRSKGRPQAEIFGFGQLTKGWTVMDRLGEIKVPTLVMAGRDDFVFPPEHQGQLAAAIPKRAPGDHRARRAQPAR